MKYKREKVVKILFVIVTVLIYCNFIEVDAAPTLEGIRKSDMVCFYDSDAVGMSGSAYLAFTYNDSKFEYVLTSLQRNSDNLEEEIKKMVTRSSDTLYCPKQMFFCSNYAFTDMQNFSRENYMMGSREECEKKFKNIAEFKYNEDESKKAVIYDYSINNGVCITTADSEFNGIYQAAKNLNNTSGVYNKADASRYDRIVKYLEKNKNKLFCNADELTVLENAVKKWNDVVTNDKTANANQKNETKEQYDTTLKNIQLISTKIDANIKLPGVPVETTCEGLIDEDLMTIINLVLNIARIAAPIVLLILITVDLTQVVISNDKEAMSKAISRSVKRAIAAVVIFFIPYIVNLIIDWLNQYANAGASNCIK